MREEMASQDSEMARKEEELAKLRQLDIEIEFHIPLKHPPYLVNSP